MQTNVNTLAKELGNEVSASLETLGTRLSKVEKELDLECLNLRDLVNSKDPKINSQIDALSKSITELHESLADVRSHLENAASEGKQIEEATTEPRAQEAATPKKSSGVELTPKEIGRQRHDEEVTLSGIFRALFMADEPEQRANHD
jgi:septal ring factor EnvC (AmiA/AmiB activator)